MKEEIISTTFIQEEYFIQTIPLIRQIAVRKLYRYSYDSVDDIVQKVALKLWSWKLNHQQKYLSEEDWLKLANCATQNEIRSFYTDKSRREIALSEIDELHSVFISKAPDCELLGNTEPEVRSLLKQLWTAIQTLSLRQKYALLFRNTQFIIDIIGNRVSSIKGVAESFELSIDELKALIVELPLADDQIRYLLEDKLQEKIALKHIWSARIKAKLKLINVLRDLNENLIRKESIQNGRASYGGKT